MLSHRSLFAGLVVVFGCSLFAGCAGDSLSDEEVEVGFARSEIQGGYVDEQDRAVVGVVHMSQGSFGSCTGSLIAPNVVLTAQHCVAPTSTGGGVDCSQTLFGAAYSPSSMYVTLTTSLTQNPSNYHGVREVVIPPGDKSFCGRDQALLILNDPIPATDVEPLVPRVDDAILEGEEYYAVGYGATFDGQGAQSGTRHRRDELFIQCVAGACPQFAIKETEWRGDTGICQGDSGGPAIDLMNRVIGVASRGAAGCEMPIYGYVLGWSQWIIDTTLYATSTAGIEAPPWAQGWPTDPHYSEPVGAPCSDSSECPSNACMDGYCTRLCDRAPCPEGYQCAESGFCQLYEEPTPPSKPKENASESETVSSCSLTRQPDPTNPTPWLLSTALLGLAWARRRRI